MSRIVQAMLAMTGRVTMLGLSRWAGKGGSYRTVQRFFNTAIAWPEVFGSSLSSICTGQKESIFWSEMKAW